MRKFVEFDIAYKGDGDLDSLGIPGLSNGANIDKGTIDIMAVVDFHKSKEPGSEKWTDTNVTLENGEEYTLMIDYDSFKCLMAKIGNPVITANSIYDSLRT